LKLYSKKNSIAISLFVVLILLIPMWISNAAPQSEAHGNIEIGDVVQGDLEIGENDTWSFVGQSGSMITIAAERFPSDQETGFDPYLELIAPDGSTLALEDDSGPGKDAAIFGFVLPQDGIYTIRVTHSTDNTQPSNGFYQLSLAENHLPDGCEFFASTTVTAEWYSTIANETLRYRVYLPPCYENTRRRYPYIILMHGSNSTDTHWESLGIGDAVTLGMALNRLPPMAIVMPYGGEIANLNVFYLNGSYEHVILQDIIPVVETEYCLQTTRDGRAIGGISRGGFWAYEIGLRHPDLFTAIGGHSPVFVYHAPTSHNPLNLVETIEWTEDSPRLYIDRAQNDYWRVNIDLMPPRLEANNIPHTFVINPLGQHQDTYWAAHLNDYLAFYSADWLLDPTTYPLCELPQESQIDPPLNNIVSTLTKTR
jgi:enterochelin esterase-like enzyme